MYKKFFLENIDGWIRSFYRKYRQLDKKLVVEKYQQLERSKVGKEKNLVG